MKLHPSQNRGLRELYATTRHLAAHWASLAARFGGSASAATLTGGAAKARSLLEELVPLAEARDLYLGPAANSVGASLAGSRSRFGDRFLERNQALRTAVLDVQHVVTLLGYQAQVAEHRGDDELGAALRRAESTLLAVERDVRRDAVALGDDPDGAIERLDASTAGRLARGTANAVGTVGEWVDRRHAGK